jgi:hypothetical protein
MQLYAKKGLPGEGGKRAEAESGAVPDDTVPGMAY